MCAALVVLGRLGRAGLLRARFQVIWNGFGGSGKLIILLAHAALHIAFHLYQTEVKAL
jgi:hypothetical protein